MTTRNELFERLEKEIPVQCRLDAPESWCDDWDKPCDRASLDIVNRHTKQRICSASIQKTDTGFIIESACLSRNRSGRYEIE